MQQQGSVTFPVSRIIGSDTGNDSDVCWIITIISYFVTGETRCGWILTHLGMLLLLYDILFHTFNYLLPIVLVSH